MSGGLSVK
jgi:hypothetical protein